MSKRVRADARTEEQKPTSFDQPDDPDIQPAVRFRISKPEKDPQVRTVLVPIDDHKAMWDPSLEIPADTPESFEQHVQASRASLPPFRWKDNEQFELFCMLPNSHASKIAFLKKQAVMVNPPGFMSIRSF